MLEASGTTEAYFLRLLAILERMVVVMERFDNVMNPTLGIAEEEFAHQAEHQPQEWQPARLHPVDSS